MKYPPCQVEGQGTNVHLRGGDPRGGPKSASLAGENLSSFLKYIKLDAYGQVPPILHQKIVINVYKIFICLRKFGAVAAPFCTLC